MRRDSPRTEDHVTPPITIPLGHQTSTSNLLVLPQIRCLVGDYPKEFFFLVEASRSQSNSVTLASSAQHLDIISGVDKYSADEHFENFFVLVHAFYPFLDRDDMIGHYENIMGHGSGSDRQIALVLAILALGATASDSIEEGRNVFSGDDFMREALKILFTSWAFSFRGDVVTSQALVLCALYFTYTTDPLMAWRLINMAATSTQQQLWRYFGLFFCEDSLKY